MRSKFLFAGECILFYVLLFVVAWGTNLLFLRNILSAFETGFLYAVVFLLATGIYFFKVREETVGYYQIFVLIFCHLVCFGITMLLFPRICQGEIEYYWTAERILNFEIAQIPEVVLQSITFFSVLFFLLFVGFALGEVLLRKKKKMSEENAKRAARFLRITLLFALGATVLLSVLVKEKVMYVPDKHSIIFVLATIYYIFFVGCALLYEVFFWWILKRYLVRPLETKNNLMIDTMLLISFFEIGLSPLFQVVTYVLPILDFVGEHIADVFRSFWFCLVCLVFGNAVIGVFYRFLKKRTFA